jgi:hypothetical protein
LEAFHRELKVELVFDSITTIVFNTSQHNSGFVWREETWQTKRILTVAFSRKSTMTTKLRGPTTMLTIPSYLHC